MTKFHTAVTGDIQDFRTAVLSGIEDLTNVSAIETHIWQHGTTPVTLTTAVLVAADRTIRFQLGDDEGWLATEATPGNWLVEYQLTFLDGTVLTWPQTPDVLPVRAQGS